MAIIVNANHVRARRRFSYAHEYVHALFDADRTITISNTDNARDFVEIRANAFASAFLMPEQGIAQLLRSMGKGERSYVNSSQTIAWLAHHFGVSYRAAFYRLQNLGYFKTKQRDVLLNEESKGREYLRILHLNQDVDVPSDKSTQNRELKAQIARLVIEAYQKEKISRGRLLDLSKLLEISGEELLYLADSENVT